MKRAWRWAVVSLVLLGSASVLSAQSPPPFYQGKTVEVVIGFGAGGGNDAYGRLLANHLGKHLPGRPAVVAKNMPGAGSFLAINHVYAVAPKDGTVVALGAPTLALDERIGREGVRFKSAELNWVGRIDSQIDVLFLNSSSPVKDIAGARKLESTLSSTGAGSASSNYPTVLNNVLGTRFKLVLGYRGSGDAMLAMERGEADGHSTAWNTLKTAKPEWLSKKTINLLVQFALDRHPELADVPTAIELGRNDEERQILHAIMSASEIGTAFFTTPGVPADRLGTLRRAFDATMQDPAFLKDAAKINFSVGPMAGEKVQGLVDAMGKLSPAVTEKIAAAFIAPPTK
jgi:tripartite-type tricarboxylate transporter receptor subunit TctC